MIKMITTVDLDQLFREELGPDIDPEIFTDEEGRQDPMFYSLVLNVASRYVGKLELAELQWFLDRTTCDYQAFRYYAELSKETVRHAPFIDETLKALHWTGVSVVLALMFRYVQRQRERVAV